MAMLVLIEGDRWQPRGGPDFLLGGREVVIGRGLGCEIRLDDQMISRRHARVFHDGDAWILEDLQSQNGSRVNGVLVTRTALRHGDVVRFGFASFEFHVAGASMPSPRNDSGSGAPAQVAVVDDFN